MVRDLRPADPDRRVGAAELQKRAERIFTEYDRGRGRAYWTAKRKSSKKTVIPDQVKGLLDFPEK